MRGFTSNRQYGSQLNNTVIPLNTGQLFTGQAELVEVRGYTTVVETDQDAIFYTDFSDNGTDWVTFPVSGVQIKAGEPRIASGEMIFKFFRVRLHNDSPNNQTELRLITYFGEPNNPIEKYLQGRDFFTEVALGNVPGYSLDFPIGVLPTTSSTWQDVWAPGGVMTLPTTGETWEIVSNNANDTLGGTGANTVLVVSHDINNDIQQTVINLNGTTPVVLSNTHYFPRVSSVILSGSLQSNQGTIVIRVSGGGAIRGQIQPQEGLSLSSIRKVERGKSFVFTSIEYHSANSSQTTLLRPVVMFPNTNTWNVTAEPPFFRNNFQSIAIAKSAIPEGTILKQQARLDGGTGSAIMVGYQGIIVDV